MKKTKPAVFDLTAKQVSHLQDLVEHGQSEIFAGRGPRTLLAQLRWRKSCDPRFAGYRMEARVMPVGPDLFKKIDAVMRENK